MKYNIFHPHCGPFNSVSQYKPNNPIDSICWEHDKGYSKLGKRSYFEFNEYDKKFISDMEKHSGFLPRMYGGVFKAKRILAPSSKESKSFRKVQDSVQTKKGMVRRYQYKRKRLSRFKWVRTGNGKWRKVLRKMPNRKRYTKKRRIYRSRRRNLQKAIVTAASAPHTHIYENEFSADLAVGTYYYQIPAVIGDSVSLKTAWDDTGEGGTLIGGNTGGETFCYCQSSITFAIKNLNQHPMYIKPYKLVARTDISTGSNVADTVTSNLIEGWKARMLDADETTVSLTESASAVSSKMQGLSLYMSSALCEKYKIYAGKGIMLEPGKTVRMKFSTGIKKIRYRELSDLQQYAFGKHTIVPVFKVNMSLGMDTGNQNECATLDGYFHCEWARRVTMKYLTSHKPLIAVVNGKRTAFTNGGEGPTDMEMKVDE